MTNKIFSYPVRIKEIYLDVFAHMNNATYLELFEEARWDLLNAQGYGLDVIRKTGLGPVILELSVKYLRELRVGDEITIQTQLISYKGKIGLLQQQMIRDTTVYCSAEFVFGLFSLESRKIVSPTAAWLHAVGASTT